MSTADNVCSGNLSSRTDEEDSSPHHRHAHHPSSCCSAALSELFCHGHMPRWKGYVSEQVSATSPSLWMLLVAFVDVVLRGVAQVFLVDHPVSGILILIALVLTSPGLMGACLLGTAIQSLTAFVFLTSWSRRSPGSSCCWALPSARFLSAAERGAWLAGLYGYDGALVGCAFWTFLSDRVGQQAVEWRTVLSIVWVAALAGILRIGICSVLGRVGLPAFTITFNVVTSAYMLTVVGDVSQALVRSPSSPAALDPTYSAAFFAESFVKGVGQFIFADTIAGGCLIVAGIAVADWFAAIFALLGGGMGGISTLFFLGSGEKVLVRHGIFGYNSAGCCAAIACGAFVPRSVFHCVVAVLGAATTAISMGAFMTVWAPVPALTYPFVITTWLFLLTLKAVAPPPDDDEDERLLPSAVDNKDNVNSAADESNTVEVELATVVHPFRSPEASPRSGF